MSVNPNQIIGSKLSGLSSDKLNFKTKGQNKNNSSPTKVLSDITSINDIKVTADRLNRQLYYGNDIHTKTGDNSHNLKFFWNSYHGQPGRITGNFGPRISGTGSSATIRASYKGEIKELLFDDLIYTFTSDNKVDISTNANIKVTFPASTNNEDGGTLSFNTQDYFNSVANPTDNEAKKYIGLGLVSYNTPNPILNITVTPVDEYGNSYSGIINPVNVNNSQQTVLTYSNGKFSGATHLNILPNVPQASLGTVEGTVSIKPSITTNEGIYGGTTNTFTTTNNGSAFTIINADNSRSVTQDRQGYVRFTYNGETNNVNGTNYSSVDKTITIYQSGGVCTLPNPTLTYSAEITSGADYVNGITISGNTFTTSFKDNSGSKAKIFNKNGNDIELSSVVSPTSNEGGDTQTVKILNFDYTREVNTSTRSASFMGIVQCNNTLEGPQGKLKGEWYKLADGTRTMYNGTTPSTTVGIGSGDYTIYQNGVTWPIPSATVKVTATPSASNPANVTNDTTRPVKLYFKNGSQTNENSITLTASSDNPEPTFNIVTDSFRPEAIGAQNSGSISTQIDGVSQPSKVSFNTSTNALTKTLSLISGITFNESYVPAMGSASWTIKVDSVNAGTNVNGSCNKTSEEYIYTVPGNDRLTGQINPVKVTASLTGSNTNYFSLSSTQVAFNKSTSNQDIIITAKANNPTASYAKLSLDSEYSTDVDDYTNITSYISTDIQDTTTKSAVLNLSSSDSNISVQSSINLERIGNTVGGNIAFSATCISGSGNCEAYTVKYTNGNATIGKVRGDAGTINFQPTGSPINVPISSGTTNVNFGTATAVPGGDTKYSISGTIQGTSINSLNGTKVLIDEQTSKEITISGNSLNPDDYYNWTISGNPSDVYISNSTNETCNLNYGSNSNSILGATDGKYVTLVTDGSNSTFITAQGGYAGYKESRDLGTIKLTCTYNDNYATGKITQAGKDYGGTTYTVDFTTYMMNCSFSLSSNSISPTNQYDIKSASFSGLTNVYDWKGSLGCSTVSGHSKTGSDRTWNYNASTETVTIGINTSGITANVSMPAKGYIYCYHGSTLLGTVTVCDKIIKDSLSSGRINANYTWYNSSDGSNWSKISNTSNTLQYTSNYGTPNTIYYKLDTGFSSTNNGVMVDLGGIIYTWKFIRYNIRYRIINASISAADLIYTAFDNPGTYWSTKVNVNYTLQQSYDNGSSWTNVDSSYEDNPYTSFPATILCNNTGDKITQSGDNTGPGFGDTMGNVPMSQGSNGSSAYTVTVNYSVSWPGWPGYLDSISGTTSTSCTFKWYGKTYYNE